MEMDVPSLIHNSVLRGTNTGKTNRIGGGGEEDKRSIVGERGGTSLRRFECFPQLHGS